MSYQNEKFFHDLVKTPLRFIHASSLMGKTVHCKCKTGCRTGRCVCYKNNEHCDDKCGCKGCHNPFTGMDIDNLSICVLQNIEEYKELSEE
ncbi:MAG: hypothetical protein GY770_22590, partial [Aestuariibacter sp.]|nr:hypothetical protein [Aestuariibacter sp.]